MGVLTGLTMEETVALEESPNSYLHPPENSAPNSEFQYRFFISGDHCCCLGVGGG